MYHVSRDIESTSVTKTLSACQNNYLWTVSWPSAFFKTIAASIITPAAHIVIPLRVPLSSVTPFWFIPGLVRPIPPTTFCATNPIEGDIERKSNTLTQLVGHNITCHMTHQHYSHVHIWQNCLPYVFDESNVFSWILNVTTKSCLSSKLHYKIWLATVSLNRVHSRLHKLCIQDSIFYGYI